MQAANSTKAPHILPRVGITSDILQHSTHAIRSTSHEGSRAAPLSNRDDGTGIPASTLFSQRSYSYQTCCWFRLRAIQAGDVCCWQGSTWAYTVTFLYVCFVIWRWFIKSGMALNRGRNVYIQTKSVYSYGQGQKRLIPQISICNYRSIQRHITPTTVQLINTLNCRNNL